MFKKSLIAVAALSALAGSAMAADVQIYGRIDTGFRYQNVDYDVAGVSDASSFEMVSGNYSGSRVGIKGSEDLGNGLTVGFVLENGFDSDDGSFDSNEEIFGREALLYLEGDFGKVGFGRMGILNSTAGSFAIGNFTPWGTGWGAVGDQSLIFGATFGSRWDNMISYRSPEFAGFQVHAQYSFGANTDTEEDALAREGKTTTDRYYAIGATYKNGGLNLIGIVDSINEKHQTGDDPDDTLRVTLGGSYDFGVVKPYLSAAYFKDAKMKTWLNSYTSGFAGSATVTGDGIYSTYLNGDWDGYGVILGASAPLVGGTAHMTIGYMDAEEQDDPNNYGVSADLTRYTFAVGYEYPLSKRTKVYADAGYFKDKFEFGHDVVTDRDPEGYQAAVGMSHYF